MYDFHISSIVLRETHYHQEKKGKQEGWSYTVALLDELFITEKQLLRVYCKTYKALVGFNMIQLLLLVII